MTKDVVERLRECANGAGSFKSDQGDFGLCDDAVDEIERLREALAESMRILKRAPGALNGAFNGGVEEREGGSDKRQERFMKEAEELRFEIPKALSKAAIAMDGARETLGDD